jgi:hypothetical protein
MKKTAAPPIENKHLYPALLKGRIYTGNLSRIAYTVNQLKIHYQHGAPPNFTIVAKGLLPVTLLQVTCYQPYYILSMTDRFVYVCIDRVNFNLFKIGERYRVDGVNKLIRASHKQLMGK